MAEPRWYPALDVARESALRESGDRRSNDLTSIDSSESLDELILAAVDDLHPSAVEDLPDRLRLYFNDTPSRDAALTAVRGLNSDLKLDALEVSDEAWAERSQAALAPIYVGRIVVSPPWATKDVPPDPTSIVLTIQPSMGFGTGHHPSTRMCLRLLQLEPASGANVLDVGTGSGVLAIAAARLGASRVVAIDHDRDALLSAEENVDLNGLVERIQLRALDLVTEPAAFGAEFDILTANLTGAMLERHAHTLTSWASGRGSLIASGFQEDEELGVRTAFEAIGWSVAARVIEQSWIGFALRPRLTTGQTR